MGSTEYCVVKIEIPEDLKEYVIVTLNQINSKQVDPSNRGSYQYAPMKMVLLKINN